jgi:hypothetical protein
VDLNYLFPEQNQHGSISVLHLIVLSRDRLLYDTRSLDSTIRKKCFLQKSDAPTNILRDCIENGVTGSIANCDNPAALANLLKQSGENLNLQQNMGMAALKKDRSLSHQEMHKQRWQLLLSMLERSKQ